MGYTKEFCSEIYKQMLRIRLCEEAFVEPIVNREIHCPVHLYSGQEAVAVGVCSNLTKEDYILGCHRSHGHFLAKGGSMKELMAEVFCRETGCSRGRGGSMHLIDPEIGFLGSAPIVGGTISLALGASLTSRIRKNNRVTVSFFGDGATGEGVLVESLNFAAIKNLPIIFVCENNFYSTHMPIQEIRANNNIYDLPKPLGIKSFRIDGNNFLEVFETMRSAVEICKSNQGPVFIEALTYRFRGHVGPNDNVQGTQTDIRPKEEIESWFKRDPLNLFKEFVFTNQLLNQSDLDNIQIKVENEVSESLNFAKSSIKPDSKDLNLYVFQ